MKLCISSLVWCLLAWWALPVHAVDCAPASKSFTIETAQDAAEIVGCPTFTGDIVISADGPAEVSLSGITTLTGNLDIKNVAKLRSLSSTSLSAVSSFTLNNLPKLSQLSFPALANFSTLRLVNLPALEDCTIATGALQGDIDGVTVANTAVKSLEWLTWPIGSKLNVTNNTNLQTFDIPYSVINTGSTIIFADNTALKTIDLSAVSSIYGALRVSNNEKLTKLAFPKLMTIGGFVQLSGAFNNVTMPILKSIVGALSVTSSGDITRLCNHLDDSKLSGHFDCMPNIEKNGNSPSATASDQPTTTATALASGTPNRGPDDGLSSGIKAGIGIAVLIMVVLSLVFLFFCLRRRSRAKVREIIPEKKQEADSIELSDTSSKHRSFPNELESPVVKVELATGPERSELPGTFFHELDGELKAPRTPDSVATSWTSVRSDHPLIRHELPG